ncbi:MAG TPA: hypothetical protein DC047_18525 [Blastocatellia bacterium]|nr:hypothetical protein [Blastocatellia bacterium]
MSSESIPISNSQFVGSVGSQSLTPNGRDEIAHVLFLDVVGFTKLRPAKQRSVLGKLQDIVRSTEDFCAARREEQLIALPTGDGMALVFLTTIDGSGPAIACAEKAAEAIAQYNDTVPEDSQIKVRMGIHSGNVVRVSDVNDRPNVAGEGINTAQRVMDCGDIGHILLSDLSFRLLPAMPDRADHCLSLGKVKVKHDQEVSLYSLFHHGIGNQETPQKVVWEVNQSSIIKEGMAAMQRDQRKRKLLWAAALGLVLFLAVFIVWATQPVPAPPTLAVLPFTPGSQKNSSKAISKGLTEQFIRSFKYLTTITPQPLSTVRSALSQPSSGQVPSPISPLEAGKKLHARYVLTGTAESHNNDANLENLTDVNPNFTVDVHAELYDTDAGVRVWNKEYMSLPFDKLIDLQGALVKEVTDKIGARMRDGEDVDINELYTKKASAHWYYMLGRFWSTERPNAGSQRQGEDIAHKAILSYEEAIKIDQKYALAYAGLADMYVSMSGTSMDPTEAKNKAVQAAKEAQNCGENLAEVNASIGTEKWWLERDFSTARIAFLLAIGQNQEFSDSHKRYSSCLAALGRVEEAEDHIQRALAIEPESGIIQFTSGQNYFFAHNYRQAITQLQKVISNNPNMSGAHRFLAMAFEQKNMNEEALDQLKKVAGKCEEDWDCFSTRGNILAHMKRSDEALKIAQSLEKLRELEQQKKENKSYVSAYNIAVIYAEIPTKEENALRWLDTAIFEFDPRVTWLKVDPRFAELKKTKESEFNQRLQAAGLLP